MNSIVTLAGISAVAVLGTVVGSVPATSMPAASPKPSDSPSAPVTTDGPECEPVIVTVAGAGGSAAHDGPLPPPLPDHGDVAVHTRLRAPGAIAIGPDGSPSFTDGGARLYRIEGDGTLSVVAGTGTPGFSGDGGPATEATLNGGTGELAGIAIAADGTVYLAEPASHRVRAVSPDGVITTVAGSGDDGDFGGDGGTETFVAPTALAVAPDGAVLFTDGDRIRRLDPADATISTVAGPGASIDVPFDSPTDLALSADGVIQVADPGAGVVHVIDPAKGSATTYGQGEFLGDGRPWTEAGLARPSGVAIAPDGGLYVSDAGMGRIRAVVPAGSLPTVEPGEAQPTISTVAGMEGLPSRLWTSRINWLTTVRGPG